MNIQTVHSHPSMAHRALQRVVILLIVLGISACASNQPKIQTDVDRDVNFSSFQTFGFIKPLGTDEAEYSTLISAYFKNAAMAEMEALGYTYTDASPDLLVNFFSNTENRSNVSTMVGMSSSQQYYSGWYFGFPIYRNNTETRTRHYKMDALKIDIIHAAEKKLIWQGSSENKARKQNKDNPEAAINAIVHLIFQQFPTRITTTP